MDNLTPDIEPSDGASPEHLLPHLSDRAERELCSPPYPPGSLALYRVVCEYADAGAGTLDLVALVEGRSGLFRRRRGPALGLTSITHTLDCADALVRGGYLRRTEDAGGERWTALLRGKKRLIPRFQIRVWGTTR